LVVAIAVGLFGAACGNRASNNATAYTNTNRNANSNTADHDMSNIRANDMSNMQGESMMNMKSDPGAAQQPFDLQFLDTMTQHHNDAIIMAKMVLGKSQRTELKTFAQKIIDDQTKEMGHMKQLRDRWYADKPFAKNMEMPGMADSMKMVSAERMQEMDKMESNQFDINFLDMMTAHHQGAVTMAKQAEQKAEHAEIKELAAQIIKAQQPEIEQMQKWKAAWGSK